MQVSKATLFKVFNGNTTLEIPFFQRPYVWEEPQWERLKEDVEWACKNKKPYFVGTIILKQKSTVLEDGDIRTVIDGQQRLTTLSILSKVLCLKNLNTKNVGDAENTEEQPKNNHIMETFNKRFRLDDGSVVIQHNHKDEKAYNKIMDLVNPDPIDSTNEKDRISCVYQYFLSQLNLGEEDFKFIGNNLYFVEIALEPTEDEQRIFDAINSLGVRLTTAELLKNYLFNRDNEDEYKEYWLGVFEKDEDTMAYWDTEIVTGRYKRTLIDVFFFSFLQIKIQDSNLKVKVEDKLSFSKVDQLFESYKSFMRSYYKDKKELLKELKLYAEVFKKTFNTNILEHELTNEAGPKRMDALIFALETTTLIPYILYVEHNADASKKAPLYEYLESYIMRRLITGMSTKNYNNVFYESLILNKVLTKDLLKKYFSEQENTVNQMPNNNDVEQAFHTSRLTNKQALGVLYMLESKIRNRPMQSTRLHGIKEYSLEHMMPKKWRNHWVLDDTKFNPEDRDKALATLGNLAIIPHKLNSSISDADWETKKHGRPGKNKKSSKAGLLEYAVGIETFFGALNTLEWNEDEIYKRADELAQKALEIWPMN